MVVCTCPLQIFEWRSMMGLEPDDVRVYADQWGLRRLFSLGIRRRNCPRKRREYMAEEFFRVMREAWGGCPPSKKKGRKAQLELDELEDESAPVDAGQLSDNEVSHGGEVELLRAEVDDYQEVDSGAAEPGSASAMPTEAADAPEPAHVLDEVEEDLEEQLLLKRIEQLLLLVCKVAFLTRDSMI